MATKAREGNTPSSMMMRKPPALALMVQPM
jgi:hypothetical protein